MAKKTYGDHVVEGVLSFMAENPKLPIEIACMAWSITHKSDEFGMWYRMVSTDKIRKSLHRRIARRLQMQNAK